MPALVAVRIIQRLREGRQCISRLLYDEGKKIGFADGTIPSPQNGSRLSVMPPALGSGRRETGGRVPRPALNGRRCFAKLSFK
jgi:hypothetical protein